MSHTSRCRSSVINNCSFANHTTSVVMAAVCISGCFVVTEFVGVPSFSSFCTVCYSCDLHIPGRMACSTLSGPTLAEISSALDMNCRLKGGGVGSGVQGGGA